MGDEMLELVKQVGEETVDAFNRGDFEAAFGYLPEDFEWHPPSEFPDSRVLRGPEETASFYRGLRAIFPDYRSEERDYQLVGDRTIITHHRMSGTGGASGIDVGADVFQVMELGEDGLPVRLREFLNRDDAERAAGVRE